MSLLSLSLQTLADIFHLNWLPIGFSQIELQSPTEQLEHHLRAHLGERRIVPSFAQFVSDEGI
jgi:hypothetical protein